MDIPYPTGEYVQKTGATSLSDSAALCWVQRCTAEGQGAWVLSLVNGSCPAKKDISCGGSSTSKTCMWEESEDVAAYYDDELEKNFPGYKLVSELPQKGSDCSENETWACVKRADAPGYAGIFQCVQCSY